MSTVYSIEHTDPNVPGFIINPSQLNGPNGSAANSSLSLHGTGRLKYGEAINENFLHLLENFASNERSMPLIFSIQSASNNGAQGTHFIEIFDNKTNVFIPSYEFQIIGSSGAINDNNYTTISSTYNQPTNLTTIIFEEILVDDQAAFLGNVSYSIIEPDPLYLKPPYNIGQTWFNKTDGVLYIYKDLSGTGILQWDYAGRLGLTIEPPLVPNDGDLWYDPVIDQLKIFKNNTWNSVADRYILKSGDTIDSNAIIAFGTHLILNEGAGDSSINPDIRSTSNLLLTSFDSSIVTIDGNNTTSGDFVVSKGAQTYPGATDLFRIENDGTIHTDILNYETLVTDPNDIPNKTYLDNAISDLSDLIGLSYILNTGGSMTGDFILTMNTATTGNKIQFETSHSDNSYIYKYEPSIDQSQLRISLSDNPNSLTDYLDIGSDDGTWNSVTRIDTFGNISTEGIITSNIPVGDIVNNKHVTTKEYVDAEIINITGGDNVAIVNPTIAKDGDILVTGSGATLEIFIYGDNNWNKIFPAVYSA